MSDKLAGVHPVLVEKVKKILYAMGDLGFRMIATDGVRTDAEQAARYAQGRTAPGKIVTNADGIPKDRGGHGVSNHQVKADGFGHAVDMTFMDDHGTPLMLTDDFPSWDEKKFPFVLYGAMAKALGLKWGGEPSFAAKGLVDLPHIELPDIPHA